MLETCHFILCPLLFKWHFLSQDSISLDIVVVLSRSALWTHQWVILCNWVLGKSSEVLLWILWKPGFCVCWWSKVEGEGCKPTNDTSNFGIGVWWWCTTWSSLRSTLLGVWPVVLCCYHVMIGISIKCPHSGDKYKATHWSLSMANKEIKNL